MSSDGSGNRNLLDETELEMQQSEVYVAQSNDILCLTAEASELAEDVPISAPSYTARAQTVTNVPRLDRRAHDFPSVTGTRTNKPILTATLSAVGVEQPIKIQAVESVSVVTTPDLLRNSSQDSVPGAFAASGLTNASFKEKKGAISVVSTTVDTLQEPELVEHASVTNSCLQSHVSQSGVSFVGAQSVASYDASESSAGRAMQRKLCNEASSRTMVSSETSMASISSPNIPSGSRRQVVTAQGSQADFKKENAKEVHMVDETNSKTDYYKVEEMEGLNGLAIKSESREAALDNAVVIPPTRLERQAHNIPSEVGAQAIPGPNDLTVDSSDISVLTTSTGIRTANTLRDLSNSNAAITATALSREDYENELREMIRLNSVEAKEVRPEKDEDDVPHPRRKRGVSIRIMVFCFIPIAVGAIIVAVVLSGSGSDGGDERSALIGPENTPQISVPTGGPTLIQTLAPTLTEESKDLLEFLQSISFDGGKALMSSGSPQRKLLLLLVHRTSCESFFC